MSVRPSLPDPAEISEKLWRGFRGKEGWDVGANCGQTILSMAFEFDHITSFEPCRESFEYATAVVWEHRLKADVLNLALSDEDGIITLAYPGQEQRETGQLVTIGIRGMEWEPADWQDTSVVEAVKVEAKRADTVAAERGIPDFIKVDTEGHEARVLSGASWILSEGKTDFLVEFHTPANHFICAERFKQHGYEVVTVRHPHYPENSQMWNQHGWVRAFAPHR